MIIKNGRVTIEDTMDKLVETEKGITCGCDNPNFKVVMHLDATDYYTSEYECDCGNHIVVVTERTEEDKMLWEMY